MVEALAAASSATPTLVFAFAGGPAAEPGPYAATLDACAEFVAAAQRCVETRARLIVVTERAHAVALDEAPTLGTAALLGIARVVQAEHPSLLLRSFDLGDFDDPHQLEALAHAIAQLDASPSAFASSLASSLTSSGPLIALRPGAEDCVELVAELAPAPTPTRVWEPGHGTVVVTGGLGGIGQAVTRWLIERGVERVLILGRRTLDEASDTGFAELVHAARAGGTALDYRAVDVADFTALEAALADELDTIVGVLHTAAVVADAPLVDHGRAELDAALRPKLAGAWNLHRLSLSPGARPLEFFVLFGSLGGWIGLPGQASYAAANAALDGLAGHRRQLGLPGVSLGWCGWTGLGFARSTGGAASLERLATEGIGGLDPRDALELLARVLGPGLDPVVAVMPSHAHAGAQAQAQARQQRHAELLALTPTARRVAVHERLRLDAAAVLGEDPARLDPARALRELGLDSLMTVELAERLARGLGVAADTTLIWRCPTLEALTDHFLAEFDALATLSADDLTGDLAADLGSGDAGPPVDELDLLAELDALSDEDVAILTGAV